MTTLPAEPNPLDPTPACRQWLKLSDGLLHAPRHGRNLGEAVPVKQVLIAVDQLAYVILTLGAGHPDETLSAAAWRTEKAGKLLGRRFRPLIDFLFLPFERDHCHKAFLAEKRDAHLPPEYRA